MKTICILPIPYRRNFPGISFWSPYLFWQTGQKQFQEIVRTLAARYGVTMPEDELLLKANQWELSHGGLTGRAAQQFIDYIVGTEEEKRK